MENPTKKAISEKQLIYTLEKIEEFPIELKELLECIKFWNREGLDCHINNNENYAKGESYEDFILRMMACDSEIHCRSYDRVSIMPSNNGDLFLTGKGGNHVWIIRKSDNERIIMIHF